MIEIEIDGKKIAAAEGTSVLEAAYANGTHIPHFCYHKKLSITASCRMCLVEVEKSPRPQPACATPVAPGMVVHTHSPIAVAAQKAVMEFLLINHPLDCPICDKGGECKLQDLAVGYGSGASRFSEEKRIVFHKNVSPLISMREMSRCIHCTRCVRFGEEIAGIREFGMQNRGDRAEITSFLNKTVDSELSGNMIDLCPVGALLSKPFRYQARNWELSSHKSFSPHDSLGTNLSVQSRGDTVLRVLPFENERINECWISDRDRFSYQGLNSEDRLLKPRIKQDNKWVETDWATAFGYIAHGLKSIRQEHGPGAIAALAAPHSTLEEMALLQKLVRGLGSEHIDFRLRQSDFGLDGQVVPWLGMKIDSVGRLNGMLLVGSFLRKDHPLLAARVRYAAMNGAKVSVLHAVDDDLLMPLHARMIKAPSGWLSGLGEIMVAVARCKGVAAPAGFEHIEPSDDASAIAESLLQEGEGNKAIFLGNAAIQHPQASKLHAAVEWLARETDATLGVLTEGANTVGGYLANALPAEGTQGTFASACKAYLLMNLEPELDCADPQAARAALSSADMVVALSPYRHEHEYADVMLPIAPFTETSGTFVNSEGLAQSFQGAVLPQGEARPGWKVLRVLGNFLELEGFDYETSEEIRDEITRGDHDLSAQLNNMTGMQPEFSPVAVEGIERIADVPIYFSDPIVRRASALQATTDARPPRAYLPVDLGVKLGIQNGDLVKLTQGQGSAVLSALLSENLPGNVVRVAAAHELTSALGPMFGTIRVEKT